MPPPPYRISLAAQSVIYAPLFAAVRKINDARARTRKDPIWEIVAPTGEHLGDRGAYKALREGAHIAVCDPMVVADDAEFIDRDYAAIDTSGVIVAFLLCRPTLWVMRCEKGRYKFARGDRDSPGTLAYLTYIERNVKIGRLATYRNSTAWMMLKFMKRGHQPYWNIEGQIPIAPGEDENWISFPNDNPVGNPPNKVPPQAWKLPDHVVTCDGLLAAKFKPDLGTVGDYRHHFSLHLTSIIPEFPFTAIVCRRAWLADPVAIWRVRKLLKEIRSAIASIHKGNINSDHAAVAAAMSEYARIFRPDVLADDGQIKGDAGDDYKTHFCNCVEELRAGKTDTKRIVSAYPNEICPDWSLPWIRRGWVFSASKLWGLFDNQRVEDARRNFAACTTTLLAPRGFARRFIGFWWNSWRRAASLNGIVVAFIGALVIAALVAFLEHSYRHEPATQPSLTTGWMKNLWFLPDSLATGVALVLWAFVVHPFCASTQSVWRLLRPRRAKSN